MKYEQVNAMSSTISEPRVRIQQLFDELLTHDGYGDMRIEMRIMRRGQKEVIIHCGKQYRYVVDFPGATVAIAEKPDEHLARVAGPPAKPTSDDGQGSYHKQQ